MNHRQAQSSHTPVAAGDTRLRLPEWADKSTSSWIQRLLSDAAFDTRVDCGLPVAQWRRHYGPVFEKLARLESRVSVEFSRALLDYVTTTARWPESAQFRSEPKKDTTLRAGRSGAANLHRLSAWLVDEHTPQPAHRRDQQVAVSDTAEQVAQLFAAEWNDNQQVPMSPVARIAIEKVLRNPQLLQLSGAQVVCLGGHAALSPARWLAAAGADVWVVQRARRSSGSVEKTTSGSDSEQVAQILAGLPTPQVADIDGDVLTNPQGIVDFIAGLPGPVIVVSTLYAAGSQHVHAVVAADAILEAVCAIRDDVTLVMPGSPTEAYCTEEGKDTNSVVIIQGPNYLSAKLIERARLTVYASEQQARARHQVEKKTSYPATIPLVLPPALSASVLQSQTLKQALAAAPRAGIHPVSPALGSGFAALLIAAGYQPEVRQELEQLAARDRVADVTPAAAPHFPHALGATPLLSVHGGMWGHRFSPEKRFGLGMARQRLQQLGNKIAGKLLR